MKDLPVALMGVGQTVRGALTSMARLRGERAREEGPLDALTLWEANGTQGSPGWRVGRDARRGRGDRRGGDAGLVAAYAAERRRGCTDRRAGQQTARVIALRPAGGRSGNGNGDDDGGGGKNGGDINGTCGSNCGGNAGRKSRGGA